MTLNPIMVMIQVDVSGTVDDVIGGVEIGPGPEPGQGSPTEITGGGRSGGIDESIGGIGGSLGAVGGSMVGVGGFISPANWRQ